MRVVQPEDWPPVTVLDLSRTGVRLGIGTDGMDLSHPATLGKIAERLKNPLSTKLVVEFDPERLGSMMRRSLEVVRIGPRHREDDVLEVGCLLSPPLTQIEVEALGMPLPPVGEDTCRSVEVVRSGLDRPADPDELDLTEAERAEIQRERLERFRDRAVGPEPVERLDASIIAYGIGPPRPLRGWTDEIDGAGGIVWVRDDSPRAREDLGDPITDRMIEFERAYGSEVDLTIERSGSFLWYGPVRVVSVERIPELPGHLIIGFAFPRELDPRELASLGLSAPEPKSAH